MYIRHLAHSGFLVVHEKYALLFDCIEEPDLEEIKDKDIVFFASHSHKDHFSPDIARKLSNYHTTYILGYDIEDRISTNRIWIMNPYDEVTLGALYIKAFGSTDRGVSFYLRLDGKSYFHSGDLNWWHWKRMKEDELAAEESDFKNELEKIRGLEIDFAFVPVDPRLEEFGLLAADYFIKTLSPEHLVPMHSFGDYGYYNDLDKKISLNDTVLLTPSGKNQIIFKEQP
ncbi:MBL fold metallo-hydrolase [Alkalibacter saccharofermentans]|uniref:L-ascorbate metabolism protein UlaG, beta-lactamase superfamily n=1 Tax=Alkalibacter saccharofermentans DSM 14828 TaxID=1120975 RepID=A0A1M4YD90_9FIRM|nr:MBL fold metallo-hydrolase [Alkalibacter saccharofermentans]SHF03717.1 L-ascorbate metabolism protein UlaG, beta-lactamase superfamily [Alkalibacter saccharofermentans DSM 14828]